MLILILVLFLPFVVKQAEQNLEIFLFIMGIAAVLVSGSFSADLAEEILKNPFLYAITGAVFVAGILFDLVQHHIKNAFKVVLKYIPLNVLLFLIVVILGLLSSLITAIIASLLLVEIINVLPLSRKNKINMCIISCFSIGLGAVLTPVGEPLATIAVSRLKEDFWFMMREIGVFIIPGIIGFGILGALFVKEKNNAKTHEVDDVDEIVEDENLKIGLIRTAKIFIFILALELLGTGFKPLIDKFVISMDSYLLYWINMISSVVDNATLASAEISTKMLSDQIHAVLLGLLISGGMLIPGNIPNIISAGKLKIKSKEWARLGVPLGLITMSSYFVIIIIVQKIF
ncbi:MAG TPA: DUF1646 family protein [Clostridia bacterium]|nr:DUF1646 family protein [Clostridia bacterium]